MPKTKERSDSGLETTMDALNKTVKWYDMDINGKTTKVISLPKWNQKTRRQFNQYNDSLALIINLNVNKIKDILDI